MIRNRNARQRGSSGTILPAPAEGSSPSPNFLFSSIEPPRFTRFPWRFVNPQIEADFVQTDLGPKYAYRIQLYGLMFSALCVVVALIEAVASRGESPVTWLALPVGLLYAGLAALGRFGRRFGASVGAMEWAVVVTLSLHSLATAICVDDRRLRHLLGRGASVPYWSYGNVDFKLALLPVLTGIFMPCQPHSYLLFLFTVMAQAAYLDLAIPSDMAPKHQRANLAMLALMLASIFWGRVHITLSRRTAFHFRREVGLAVEQAELNARDRQELQRLDERNKTALLTAQAAKNARSRLIRMVMHDLRSPLLSVVNLAVVLREMPAVTTLGAAPVVQRFGALHTCAVLMEHIVSDMLDFERIDSGRLVLVPAPLRIERLLRNGLATFAALADSKGVTLSAEPLEADLAALRVMGDARRLQQCLNNGISNSIKFTERGGSVRIRATLERAAVLGAESAAAPGAHAPPPAARPTRHSDAAHTRTHAFAAGGTPVKERGVAEGASAFASPADEGAAEGASAFASPADDGAARAPAAAEAVVVRVRITDSGIGLTAEELQTLRHGDLFSQVGRGQLQGNGGSGLGLSITRQLLGMHAGSRLELCSDGPKRGTTFELILKLETAPWPAASERGEPERTSLSGGYKLTGGSSWRGPQQPGRSPRGPMQRAATLPALDVAGARGALPSAAGGNGGGAAPRAHGFGDRAPAGRAGALEGAGGGASAGPPRRLGPSLRLRPAEEEARAEAGGGGDALAAVEECAAQRAGSGRAPSLEARGRRASCGCAGAGGRGLAEAARPGAGGLRGEGAEARGARAAPGSPKPASAAAGTGSEQPLPGQPHPPAPPEGGLPARQPAFEAAFRVLYVDDDRFLQQTVPARIFELAGLQHDVASDGAEALRLVADGPPGKYGLVLMDNQMPILNGTAATRLLRASGFRGKVVGMTGDPAGCAERDEFEAAGLNACVDKTTAGIEYIANLLSEIKADYEQGGAGHTEDHAHQPEPPRERTMFAGWLR